MLFFENTETAKYTVEQK